MNANHFHTAKRSLVAAGALLLAGAGVAAAESWPTNYAALGTLVITQFVTAPFPHPARAEGHTYQGEFFSAPEHYADSTVAMFIPKNFHASDRIDFVIHFHGWRNSVGSTLAQFDLIEQFAASGKNAVLLVPEGPRNAADSFGGKLEDTNGLARFMTEAMTTLRASGAVARTNLSLGRIILSGHSGGYHVMAAIVDHGGLGENIQEVWLFDALYGGTEHFARWQQKGHGRLLDIYTDHGGTRAESENWMASLKTNGISFFAGEDTNAVPENLRTNQIIFLHTDMVHHDVVAKRGTFGQFLKASCLTNP